MEIMKLKKINRVEFLLKIKCKNLLKKNNI